MARLPSPFERDVLDVVLRELRRAMRLRTQLSILIDPYTRGAGTYVFASAHEAGFSYEITAATPLANQRAREAEASLRRKVGARTTQRRSRG